ncbi:hypothetical protein LOTGIDRAFT_234123 [Lottia gigantea]|uniref:Uncharacterized protein n=1 Tax=Lottia gigantea TaxID=225164 RepID=V4A403_LOTGI|nr:hypothetical protein LOTGIDRAFT_234123 [Lottia gigantea]ESO89720.1 hypothetical protein LOTGIDRAFT_234123 [Lottia gigantea]
MKSVKIDIDDGFSSGSSDSVPLITKKKKDDSMFVKFTQSAPEQHSKVKAVICFPIGCAVGVLFYYFVINPIDMEQDSKLATGTLLGFIITVGYGVSTQVRCIITLVLPIFFGQSGRSYVAAFALVYIIGGPVSNLIVNSSEMVRSLSCITQLMANHSGIKFDLRFKPMKGSLTELQEKGFVTKGVEKKFTKAFEPIEKELEDQAEVRGLKADNDKADSFTGNAVTRNELLEEKYKKNPGKTEDKKVERKWEKKLDYRCEDVFSQGVLRCRKWFANTYDKCMDELSVAGYLLCWPMKLDFFCELVNLLPGAFGLNCDSMKVVNPGVGETYMASKEMANELKSSMDVNLQYKMIETPMDLNYMTAEEVRKKTIYAFEKKKKVVKFLLLITQRLLAFTFILVFLSAYQYHKKYLSDFRHDNNYISGYFKRIDARRKADGKSFLLPLKKLEKKEVVYPTSCKLQKKEAGDLIKGTVTLFFRVFLSIIIVMLDHLLYTVLYIIGKNCKIDYKQTGSHHIDLKVYGEGFMGDIVRLFLSSFNQKHDIDQITSNAVCLPYPSKADKVKVTMIFSVYAGMWFLLYLQAYGLRLRRVIGGFFYRKREKRRTLYLYNDMLKKRKGFLKMMRHRVRKQVKAQVLKRNTSIVVSLKKEFPKLCCWLKLVSSSKDVCLICEDKEGSGYHKCTTPNCNFGYCGDCWEDIQEICYACMSKGDSDSSGSSSDSSNSDIE